MHLNPSKGCTPYPSPFLCSAQELSPMLQHKYPAQVFPTYYSSLSSVRLYALDKEMLVSLTNARPEDHPQFLSRISLSFV